MTLLDIVLFPAPPRLLRLLLLIPKDSPETIASQSIFGDFAARFRGFARPARSVIGFRHPPATPSRPMSPGSAIRRSIITWVSMGSASGWSCYRHFLNAHRRIDFPGSTSIEHIKA